MQAVDDSPTALIVKDCNPWYAPANEYVLDEQGVSYAVINSDMLADVDLSGYSLVVIPSTQTSSYYRRLGSNRGKLRSFVESGGTLVGHIGTDGYPCGGESNSVLPGGVWHSTRYYENVSVVTGSHPVLDGISGGQLDNWNYSTHGYLTGVPDDATIVYGIAGQSRSQPAFAEYGLGDGRVLATTHTMEWPWSPNNGFYGTKQLLRNELSYALSGKRSDGSAPGEFSDLADTKQALAGSVTEAANDLDERDRVEATLDSLGDAVEAGEIEGEAATDAVRRMILAENVTQAALSGVGPAGDLDDYDPSEFDLDVETPDDIESYDTAKIAVDGVISIFVNILLSQRVLRKAKSYLPSWASSKIDEAIGVIDDLIEGAIRWVVGKFDDVVSRIRGTGSAISESVEDILAESGKQGKDKAATFLFDKIEQVDRAIAGELVGVFETTTANNIDDRLADLDADLGGDGTIDADGEIDDAVAEAQAGIDDIQEDVDGAKTVYDLLNLTTTVIDFFEVFGLALAATGIGAVGTAGIQTAGIVLTSLFNVTKSLVGVGVLNNVVDRHNRALDGVVSPTGGA